MHTVTDCLDYPISRHSANVQAIDRIGCSIPVVAVDLSASSSEDYFLGWRDMPLDRAQLHTEIVLNQLHSSTYPKHRNLLLNRESQQFEFRFIPFRHLPATHSQIIPAREDNATNRYILHHFLDMDGVIRY